MSRHPFLLSLLACSLAAGAVGQGLPESSEIEFTAAISAPFRSSHAGRTLSLLFQRESEAALVVSWKLELLDSRSQPLRTWHGESLLAEAGTKVSLPWDGRSALGRRLADGLYTLRMTSVPLEVPRFNALPGLDQENRVEFALEARGYTVDVQEAPLMVGAAPRVELEPFRVLPDKSGKAASGENLQSAPATGGLAYQVYYGNLHSHANHSDGGIPVSSCGGSEVPQGGAHSPSDAFTYMKNTAGGDFLLVSEHNHMYDGSTGTNTAANPETAKTLFNAGLAQAATFNAANPGFLALYGLEWGTLATGAGHLNLLNPDGLAEWELNASGQVIGHYLTPKADYGALYTFMKGRNWVGQFNHPSSSQFQIGTTGLAYTADGGEVMALCEVLNTKAFSVSTNESETSRSTYTSAWNVALERGYKLAPSSDQDNHCANWGMAYGNRTGVLIPAGMTFTQAAFLDAVRARRTFATEDKGSQIILTANGHLMGETFASSGNLTLTVNYASTTGRSASAVEIYEGVPGRNGTVTLLTSGQGTYTFTPSEGKHFYYAKITQDNGDRLWSAPVWVEQGATTADTQAPTVSASETGTSGTITLGATATDNVGVTRVEFYIDNALQGTDTTAPYALTLDSKTLTNASHSLVAKAYDAAGNVGTSTTVAFTINNPVPDTTAPTTSASVVGSSGLLTLNATATDAVGVTRVEFYVDGVLKGTDTTAPYALALDSTTLANGSHSLVTKAYDAAGNVGTSVAVAFVVSNPVADTTAPTVSASETGTSGTITLSATATDNVGVARVEFYVDNALKGTDTASPYAMTLDSTPLANGSHTLVAKAFDAAGNMGTSTTVAFTISNPVLTEKILNGGFESGATSWNATSGVITNDAAKAARGGTWKAWLCGFGSTSKEFVSQTVTIPTTATQATFSFWMNISTAETGSTAYDTLKVTVRNSSNTVLKTLATYSNVNAASGYAQKSFDMSAYKGQTIKLDFEGTEDSSLATSFLIDDVSLLVK